MNAPPINPLNILAIGAETTEWTTTIACLRQDKHQVTTAATELNGRFAFQSNPPEVVLLGDLPERASLLSFLRACGERDDLFILALASPDEANTLLEQFDEVIETPVTLAKVRRRLQTAVRLKEANERHQATEPYFLETIAALQESEARYRQIFETNQAVKMVINPRSGRIVEANQAAADFYGYSRETLKTMHIQQINTLPEEEIRAKMQYAKARRRLSFNFQHRLASGEIREVEVYSGPVLMKNETLLYSIIQDVTERNRAARLLQEREWLLRQQLDLNQALQAANSFDETVDICLTAVLDIAEMETAVLHLYEQAHASHEIQVYHKTRAQSHQGADLLPNTPHTNASADIPLRHHGKLIGSLTLGSAKPEAITEQTSAALETIAGQISGILIHARAEEKLLQLSRAVEQSPASIMITDLNGLIEYVNPKFTTLTGYSAAEVIGRKPSILKSGHTPPEAYAELWQTVLAGGEWRGEFRNIKKNGEHYWECALISPIKKNTGQVTHFLAIKEDLTVSKQLQMELEQRYRELQSLNHAIQVISASLNVNEVLETVLEEAHAVFNVNACAIWLYDEKHNGLFCRQSVGSLEEDVLGWWLDAGQELIAWVASHGESLIIDNLQTDTRYHLPHEAAHSQPRSTLVVPLLMQQQVIGVFQMLDETVNRFDQHTLRMMQSLAAAASKAIENARLHEDLKKQYENLKEAQTRLLQSEKLAAIGEIVAGVAHELNNPLAAVVLYSQLLLRKNTPIEIQSDLKEIATQARRASSIVRGLLDFARQRPPERKKTLINDLILSTLQLLAYDLRTHNVVSFTRLAPDIPAILVDPHQLQQLVINLINNANQAMVEENQGGNLTIITELDSHPRRSNTQDRPVVRLIFQDDGPGIPEALQTRIFDPFFTTKGEQYGTGLGLSVCQSITTEHGGEIWVESQPGQGATFVVELPLLTEWETAVSHPHLNYPDEAPDSKRANGSNILVIDDEPSLIQVITRLLRRHQYQVETATSGDEGLQMVGQKAYDLIICDLRMPGMSGIEFYEALSAQFPESAQRIIFTTGDVVNASTLQFFHSHNLTYLAKPFELNELLHLITSITAR